MENRRSDSFGRNSSSVIRHRPVGPFGTDFVCVRLSRPSIVYSSGPGQRNSGFGNPKMCLWKLMLLGWKRSVQPDAGAVKETKARRRQQQHNQHPSSSSSSDDDLSDSGISSGEFSLENVCDSTCADPAPPSLSPKVPPDDIR